MSPEGTQLGIKPLPEALHMARELDLDLVEVAPQANPPVCKILDYGKWKYEAAQRDKESRRKTSNISIKEMKYRPKIGQGDFDTKTKKVEHFLGEGHKVKITIMFRGREQSYPHLGKNILDRIAEFCITFAKVEAAPKLDGRNMIMVLAPDKRAQAAHEAAVAAGEAELHDPATAQTPVIPPENADTVADSNGATENDDSPASEPAAEPAPAEAAATQES